FRFFSFLDCNSSAGAVTRTGKVFKDAIGYNRDVYAVGVRLWSMDAAQYRYQSRLAHGRGKQAKEFHDTTASVECCTSRQDPAHRTFVSDSSVNRNGHKRVTIT